MWTFNYCTDVRSARCYCCSFIRVCWRERKADNFLGLLVSLRWTLLPLKGAVFFPYKPCFNNKMMYFVSLMEELKASLCCSPVRSAAWLRPVRNDCISMTRYSILKPWLDSFFSLTLMTPYWKWVCVGKREMERASERENKGWCQWSVTPHVVIPCGSATPSLPVYLIAAILTRLSSHRDDAPTVNSGKKIRLASVRMPLQKHYIQRSKVSLCAASMITIHTNNHD